MVVRLTAIADQPAEGLTPHVGVAQMREEDRALGMSLLLFAQLFGADFDGELKSPSCAFRAARATVVSDGRAGVRAGRAP